MNSVEIYRNEWEQLLCLLLEQPDHIRDLATQGHLKTSKFRSVYWTLLLRVLTTDYNTWPQQRFRQRQRYEIFQKEFFRNPSASDASLQIPGNHPDHPLSQSEESIWHQYFKDENLLSLIKQDVVRAFPGVDFFRKPTIQNSMCRLISYYAREHPYMGYRQGMHEILGPLIFVMYGDHQSLLTFLEMTKESNTDHSIVLLQDVLNPNCLESDCYFLFARLMAAIESYYRVDGNCPLFKNGIIPKYEGGHQTEQNDLLTSQIGVIAHLNAIRDHILIREDYPLYRHLTQLDIPLHLFGIRWLRLLFGREFALVDLLVLWDAFFADSDRFDLPNYMIVAMLCRIRDKLLISDYNACLTFLMRYPTGLDIGPILQYALHLQMPKKYSRPKGTLTLENANNIIQNGNAISNRCSSNHLKSSPHSITNSSRRTINPLNVKYLLNDIVPAIGSNNKFFTHSRSISEENLRKKNDALTIELQNTQSIIILTRRKLLKHLRVLRASSGCNSAAISALDDIEKLCDFLDIKVMYPAAQIDKAIEANEQSQNAATQCNLNVHKVKCNNSNSNENVTNHNNCEIIDKHNYVNIPTSSKMVSCSEYPWINCLEQLNPSLARLKEIELHNIEKSISINIQCSSEPHLPLNDSLYNSYIF